MSELRIETLTMPAADVGPENPLPPLAAPKDAHAIKDAPGVSDEMLRNIAYGRVPNPLPYTIQDRYTREKRPKDFRVAVLENEILRATFLLEAGGRLWSLLHKPSGRELLSVNPVFQPANLAIRNAWFSGGVEWNIGTIGHCPFTCSPIFASRVVADDGTPVLRLCEWERIRGVPFQVDAWLPDGSPVLLTRVRIRNPNDTEVPMYWWSNMAVPETEGTRVIANAPTAYKFGYGEGGFGRVDMPEVEGNDVTYTTRIDRAADFFFHVEDGDRPWITALDEAGTGLIQTSTSLLKGRKLFMWGTGPGGQTWQTFLSRQGTTYLEIQAGLARTQLEHLPMPAGADWTWMEAYGLMQADPAVVHGPDWGAARQTIDSALGDIIPADALEQELERAKPWADRVPAEVIQRGSGWGALERLRREAAGMPAMCSDALPFDDASLTDIQSPWVSLLETGALPEADISPEPAGYLVQPEWRQLLEDALEAGRGEHWFSWLHVGVMRYGSGDRSAAREAWERSLTCSESPWALRNLALLDKEHGQTDQAAERYVAACRLNPHLIPLAVECGRFLTDAEMPQEWLDLYDSLPNSVRSAGRVRLLEGQAALQAGDLVRVEALFREKLVIEDLREGERSLSQLWFEYHEIKLSGEEGIPVDDALRARVREEFPVPREIDFRMSSDQ